MNPTLIVLTGAASGIGKQLVHAFLERKIPLILVDLDAEKLENLTHGSEAVGWVDGDVAQEATWYRVVETVKKLGLPISHLINCAGVIRPGFVEDYALGDIDFHLNCNAKGSILGTTVVGRVMKEQGFGHILNISSLAGLAPVSGLSLYAASKFAVRGFSLSVAAELKKYGVWVTVICPDLVNTPMLDLQLGYPEETKLTFSGPKQVLEAEDVVRAILRVMESPRALVCIPESRGLLAKIAGTWPWIGELFRKSLEKKGEKAIQSRKN
jgi:3-oxoacyl-[acyl-carrier protein] reductase